MFSFLSFITLCQLSFLLYPTLYHIISIVKYLMVSQQASYLDTGISHFSHFYHLWRTMFQKSNKFIDSDLQRIHWDKWARVKMQENFDMFFSSSCYLTRKLSANKSFDQMNALRTLHLLCFSIESSNEIN